MKPIDKALAPLESELEYSRVQNNIKGYKKLFVVERWLRRICYAAYVAVYAENMEEHIKKLVGDKLDIRKSQYDSFGYFGSLPENSIWLSTISELKNLAITSSPAWNYISNRTGFKQKPFELKIKEFEMLRNIIAHSHLLEKKALDNLEDLYSYFSDGVKNFINILSLSEKEHLPFYEQRLERAQFVPEKDEDYLSYVIYSKERNSSNQYPRSFNVFKTSDDLIVNVEFLDFGMPNIMFLLKSISKDKHLLANVIAVIVSEDCSPSTSDAPANVSVVISKRMQTNRKAVNSLISILFNEDLRVNTDEYEYLSNVFIEHPLVWNLAWVLDEADYNEETSTE